MSISEKLNTVAENVHRVYMAGERFGNKNGYDLGYGNGHADGMTEGYELGHDEGYTSGYTTGVQEGTNTGYERGMVEGRQAGYAEGYDDGEVAGYSKGTTAEHDRFWDAYQVNGNRSNYNYAFRADAWSDVNFYPKYDIKPVNAGAQYMFASAFITDLKQRLVDCNVTLDMSECTQLYQLAPSSKITAFPELGGDKITNINNAFQSCTDLKSIDKLHLSTSSSCACASAFTNVPKLVEIRFNEGIRPNSLDFKSCTLLSRASLENLISSVADDYTTTITVSKKAVDAAFPDRTEWDALCNTKPNLTVTEV